MGSRINTEFSLGPQVKTGSNYRPRVRDGRNVTIDVWDYYRTDRWTTETMPGEEFVRRFLLHIIPPYVHRVRYAGCFQSDKRKSRLEGMLAAILEQNRQQGIASPRAEHKAKLMAMESVQRPSQNRLFLGVVRVSA